MEKRVWVPFGALSKTAKIKRGISLSCEAGISLTSLIMAAVYGAKGDENNRLFTCLMTGLLLWVPVAAERIFRHRFSFSQHLAFILLLLGGALLGAHYCKTRTAFTFPARALTRKLSALAQKRGFACAGI